MFAGAIMSAVDDMTTLYPRIATERNLYKKYMKEAGYSKAEIKGVTDEIEDYYTAPQC